MFLTFSSEELHSINFVKLSGLNQCLNMSNNVYSWFIPCCFTYFTYTNIFSYRWIIWTTYTSMIIHRKFRIVLLLLLRKYAFSVILLVHKRFIVIWYDTDIIYLIFTKRLIWLKFKMCYYNLIRNTSRQLWCIAFEYIIMNVIILQW